MQIYTYAFSKPSLTLSDGGFYSCSANNSVGSAAKGFRILVVPKPDAEVPF